jgi:ABC-type sugar transport system ATPase subunit
VDVATRRQIWKSILHLKQHSSIILVTHAIDEAEQLAERVGIMINGALVCLGPPQRLKSLYGATYKITLRTRSAQQGRPEASGVSPVAVADALTAAFPAGAAKVAHIVGATIEVVVDMQRLATHQDYAGLNSGDGAVFATACEPQRLDDGRVVLADEAIQLQASVTTAFLGRAFALINAKRSEWGVLDWSIGQTSLTEVFVRLAQHHRAHADGEATSSDAADAQDCVGLQVAPPPKRGRACIWLGRVDNRIGQTDEYK